MPRKNSFIFSAFIFILIFTPYSIFSEDKYKWEKFGGQWVIGNSMITEKNAFSNTWNYYELINFNSIISARSIDDYSSIEVTSSIFDREKTPSEFMISFNVTSESQSWFYHVYAFKISGGFWGMNKASLIFSDRIDKTRPMNTKNNIFIKELATADCKIKYDKMTNFRISFEGSDAVLYINNEKILSAPFPEKSHNGRIAISSRNVRIAVEKVEVKKDDKIIFEDDFTSDTLYIKKSKVTREIDSSSTTEKK